MNEKTMGTKDQRERFVFERFVVDKFGVDVSKNREAAYHYRRARELWECWQAALASRAAVPTVESLQAFKDYVHKRLDDAGIATHPNGHHSKHGCRIGDRLDIALNETSREWTETPDELPDLLRAVEERLREEDDKLLYRIKNFLLFDSVQAKAAIAAMPVEAAKLGIK